MNVLSDIVSELVVGLLAGFALWRSQRNKKRQDKTEKVVKETQAEISTDSGRSLGQIVEQLGERVNAQRADLNHAATQIDHVGSQITSLIDMQADVFKGLVGDMTKRDRIFEAQAEAARTQTEVNRELLKLLRKENGHG